MKLRNLPHRVPAPTDIHCIFSRFSALPPPPLELPAEVECAELASQGISMALQLEAQLFLVKKELSEVRAAKDLRAVDRRVLTKKRTGISLNELRKAREERINKDFQALERKLHRHQKRQMADRQNQHEPKGRSGIIYYLHSGTQLAPATPSPPSQMRSPLAAISPNASRHSIHGTGKLLSFQDKYNN